MIFLIIGLVMWSAIHFIPAIAISRREQLIKLWGEVPYKIIFAVLIVTSVVVMVLGWRSINPVPVYTPPPWAGWVSTLLMLATFVLFAAAYSKSKLRQFIRHPQLSGLVIWSIAHLLANGDNRSLLLFSTLGVWAIVEIILINRREGAWVKPAPASFKSELLMVFIGVSFFTILLFAHSFLFGVSAIAL